MNKKSKGAAGTFALNKGEPIHRWYSYIEGYSSCLIQDLIDEIGAENITSIYDPFGGTGTTPLVASHNGIASYFSETNPFMCEVVDAKINCVKALRESGIGSSHLRELLASLIGEELNADAESLEWDGFEKFFEPDVLPVLKALKAKVCTIDEPCSRKIALVALAAVTVRASKMVRQGDLRFAKPNEKKVGDTNIIANYIQKLAEVIEDIEGDACLTQNETICVSPDARDIDLVNQVDCVITSPPYLNGTNYIRNTKLELKLTDFLKSESDMPTFHSKGIIAGINNVSKRNSSFEALACVKPYLDELEPVAYDKRIPIMVAGYFHDMDIVIQRLSEALRDGGYFIMDIGDSQFAGVHIPTHEILTKICELHGFSLYAEDILRERRSKNGMVLSQRLLKFRLHKAAEASDFEKQAKDFMEDLPYKKDPYSGRNWGHAWHSLCSYHGKLKPAIAYFLIEKFTNPGDVVVDPLSGVGTIPLEACLQGRIGVGNDLSQLAYIVSKAKLEKSERAECDQVLDELSAAIAHEISSPDIDSDIEKYENFGFNGKVATYFHPDTYREILVARRFFLRKFDALTAAEAMVFACFLHVLHGNRPYALSRNSHPLTPYAPKGEFVYKNVVEHIKAKLDISYAKPDFSSYKKGFAIYGDYNDLATHNLAADAVICSPPFADSIRFYMQNWMRLWLCGWEAPDYKSAETRFLDQKQKNNFDVYTSFFKMCYDILKPGGKVILHLGKTDKIDMADELARRAEPYFTEVYRGAENVQEIEKHGVKDKGATLEHQFLFLVKK